MAPPIKLIRLNAQSLAYMERGSGDTMVFVHGGFSDLRSWESQLAYFSAGYRCIAYSLRYHYPNPWRGDGSDYTLPVHCSDLASLIERLRTSPAHIIGTSYGGRIALHLARDRPELVHTLILAEPSLGTLIRDTADGVAALDDLTRKYFEPGEDAIRNGDLEGAVRLFTDGVGGDGTFERLPNKIRKRYLDNIRVQAFPGSPAPFSRDDAKKIGCPVLLMNGDLTNRVFVMVNDALEECLPNVSRVRIPRATHLLTIFNPNEFNEAVQRFLDSLN